MFLSRLRRQEGTNQASVMTETRKNRSKERRIASEATLANCLESHVPTPINKRVCIPSCAAKKS